MAAHPFGRRWCRKQCGVSFGTAGAYRGAPEPFADAGPWPTLEGLLGALRSPPGLTSKLQEPHLALLIRKIFIVDTGCLCRTTIGRDLGVTGEGIYLYEAPCLPKEAKSR